MRALVYDGPGSVSVQERPDPRPAPGEVLLQVIATGICGSDLHGYTGENGRRTPGQVMGHETVARVVEVKAGGPAADDHSADHPADHSADREDRYEDDHKDDHGNDHGGRAGCGGRSWDVGSLVTINPVIGCGSCRACHRGQPQQCARRRVIGVEPSYSAAMAEYMVVPAANVVPLPAGLPPELGALIEPLAVGWHAARRGMINAGDVVLIQGAGPIGQSLALAARRADADKIVVSEPDPRRRNVVAAFGFQVVDPTGLEGDALAVGGATFDVVLDGVGTTQTIGSALASTALGSRIVLVGMNEPQLNLAAYAISSGERSILGSFCYTPAEFIETAAWAADHADELVRLIDGTVDLDGAAAAFRGLADRSLPASKVLIFPHGIGSQALDLNPELT